jgi:hypothetical protein
MESKNELFDQLFLAKIQSAKDTPLHEKLFAGVKLYDEVLRRMRDGIRFQFPHFDATQLESELERRLQMNRMVDTRR